LEEKGGNTLMCCGQVEGVMDWVTRWHQPAVPVGWWGAAARICCSVCSPDLAETAAAAERKPVPTGQGEPFECVCLIMQTIYLGCELLPRTGF